MNYRSAELLAKGEGTLILGREFQKLWAGQTVSLVGTALTVFVLPTLAILSLHATPWQLGVLAALETVPFPLLGLIIGVLADRFSRRRIMICADIVRFVTLGTVPLAAALHILGMPQLYAVALLTGCASAFFGIAYQAYLPVVVPVEGLADANMKLELSNSGSEFLGKALAGVLVQWIGTALTIALDAFSYLVSVVSLALIRVAEPPHDGPSLSLRQGLAELREGWRVVFDSPDLRWILGATASINFGGSMFQAVVMIYSYQTLHLQPALLGIVFGVANVGFVGALMAVHLRRLLGIRATLIAALAICGISYAFILLAQVALPYFVIFLAYAIEAVFAPIYNVNQISYRQGLIDVRLQGRMNAILRTFVWGTLPLGALAGGYTASAFGIQPTIIAGSVISTMSALWLLPLRERNHPERSASIDAT